MPGRVMLTEGDFDIQGVIDIATQSMLVGMGRGTRLLVPSGTAVLPVLRMQGSAGSHIGNPVIRDLYIDAAGADANGGILADHVSYLRMYNVIIANLEGYALKLEAVWDAEIMSCQLANCGTGSVPNVYILNAADDDCNNISLIGVRIEGYDGTGLLLEQVTGAVCRVIHLIACKIHARSSPSDVDNMVVKGASNGSIIACNFGNSHTDHAELIFQAGGSLTPDEWVVGSATHFRSPSVPYHIDVQSGDRIVIDGGIFETEPDTHHIKIAAACDGTVIGASNQFCAGAVSKVLDNGGTNTRDNYHWGQAHAATELTIASGAITVTQPLHRVDTESDDPTDDLETINGGQSGMIITLMSMNAGRDVTLKDGTGNLKLAGDFTLDETTDTIMLIYDGGTSKWIELCHSSND